MRNRNVQWNALFVLTLLLSVVSLFIEQMETAGLLALIFTNIVDFSILFILLAESISGIAKAPYKAIYLRRNAFSLSFSVIFIILFLYNKAIMVQGLWFGSQDSGLTVLLIRNFFLVLKVFSRYRRIAGYIEGFRLRPALTIMLSFLIVILAGTWLLMMPFTARVGNGLPFLDALFTATSAVCVTGLIVVDTATYFSVWGQIVIITLIQIGGLGIMVLSYFTLFVLGRRISVEQKKLVSYMLSEDDMGNLKSTLKSIIGVTFIVEIIGMLLLTVGMSGDSPWPKRLFFGLFHSVSAFCNAGFALFSDSLESFSNSPLVILVISLLIISGGLSFGVFVNLKQIAFYRIRRRRPEDSQRKRPVMSLNTRIVLSVTGLLLLSGTVAFYALEHRGVLAGMPLGRQYIAAFFQSVTLRTAGFNSLPFGSLSVSTIVVMLVFMFIGGASGSTAGGIKVNTLAVLFASVRSAWRNDPKVILRSQTVDAESVSRAFLILLFGVVSVTAGSFVLSLTQTVPFQDILFETVSAFGTVGLSTGLTPHLDPLGKTVIISLMFIGRLGPLTVLAASSSEPGGLQISYPRADIAVG